MGTFLFDGFALIPIFIPITRPRARPRRLPHHLLSHHHSAMKASSQSNRGRGGGQMKKPVLALAVIALISGQHLPRASAQQIPGGTSWAGFVIPHSIADPNGDGINIFGLSGLSGTATNFAINTGISQLIPLVRGTIGQLIRPRQRRPYFSESPQAFTNTLRRENNARNARIAAAKEQEKAVEEALKTLQQS